MRKVKRKPKKSKLKQQYALTHAHVGIVCLHCGSILVSYHFLDKRICGCVQKTFVKGGQVPGKITYSGTDLNLLQGVAIVPINQETEDLLKQFTYYTKDVKNV